jgi:molybdopterin converting factor small subunit
MVTIELFGVPRMRAGLAQVIVEAATVGDALVALGRACPALAGSVIVGNGVHPAYRLSINGQVFVTDTARALQPGDALLLMAADAGG